MSDTDRKKMYQILDNNNYDAFIKMYKKYNSKGIIDGIFLEEFNRFCPIVYFPSYALVEENGCIIDEIDILIKNNFEKITLWDCECG
jgi:hypothetical protein